MRRYDVYRNPNVRRRKAMPYLVVLQADVVAETDSVIVAALAPLEISSPSRLYPEFQVEGYTYTLLTPDLASAPREALVERVTSLAAEWTRITGAIDVLFTGI